MVRWVIGSIPHGELIELFLVPDSAPQPVFKGHCMCYPVCGMVHIKDPLLLIKKNSSSSGVSKFPLFCYLSGPLLYI